ncbi:hypothetical protein FPL09_05290 [Spiribacter vilamensis]|nr:hypothetical protein FPL09_05290 [Spiribacter vilamensis]
MTAGAQPVQPDDAVSGVLAAGFHGLELFLLDHRLFPLFILMFHMKHRVCMTPRILPFLALITLILVTGCGVKGDLYLPDDRDAADSEEGMS